jgi:hypothetical protein
MAYDAELAERIRSLIGEEPGIDEQLERWVDVGVSDAQTLPPKR